jgi:pilus assembly protein CpaE
VLVVQPDLEAAIEVGEMVDVQPDMNVVGIATSGQDAMRSAAELRPDVILTDVHLSDVDGIHAVWLIASKHPDSSVVIVTAENKPEYMQRAIVAGAQGYLLKPIPETQEFANTLRTMRQRAVGRRPAVAPPGLAATAAVAPARLGRRIALFSPKGGQGKTTIAVNLAVMLRQLTGQPVVLVDADLRFGDANILLDLAYERSVVDVLPHIDSLDGELLQQVLTRHSSGLHLLVRPERPEIAETITSAHIERVLTTLPQSFEHVVIDCEVSYDERLLAVLDNADSILLVLTPNMGALRNAKHFLKLAQGLGYERQKIDIVINRANSNVNLKPGDIERALGTGRYFRLGSYGRILTNDLNSGTPTVLARPRAEFTRLVGEIAEHLNRQGPGSH